MKLAQPTLGAAIACALLPDRLRLFAAFLHQDVRDLAIGAANELHRAAIDFLEKFRGRFGIQRQIRLARHRPESSCVAGNDEYTPRRGQVEGHIADLSGRVLDFGVGNCERVIKYSARLAK